MNDMDYSDDVLLQGAIDYQRRKRRRKMCITIQFVAVLFLVASIVVLGVWLDVRADAHKKHPRRAVQRNGTSNGTTGPLMPVTDLRLASRGAAHWKQDKEDASLVTIVTIDEFLIKVKDAAARAGEEMPDTSVIAPQTVIAYIRDMRLDSLWQVLRDFSRGKPLADLPLDEQQSIINTMKKMMSEEGVREWGKQRASRHITKGNVGGLLPKAKLIAAVEKLGFSIEDFQEDQFPTPVPKGNATKSGTGNTTTSTTGTTGTTKKTPAPESGNRRLLAAGFHDLCIPIVINVMQYPHPDGALPEVGRYTAAAEYLIKQLNQVFSNGEYLQTDGREDKKSLIVPRVRFQLAEIRDDAQKHRYLLMQDEAIWNSCNTKAYGDLLATAQGQSGVDPTKFINIFVCGYAGMGAAGWAYIPGGQGFNESISQQQHIVLAHEVLSQYGQGMNRPEAFDEGSFQIAHQIGHHLGLDHPNQGGCTADGDQVGDTPQTQVVSSQSYFFDLVKLCDRWRRTKTRSPMAAARAFDSCPDLPGPDPVFNWMELTAPSCDSHITARQVQRLHLSILYYRPGLYNNAKGKCT